MNTHEINEGLLPTPEGYWYNKDTKRIVNPGKFEGEFYFAPYYWDCFLNGMADEDNGEVIRFEIGDTDIDMFPELMFDIDTPYNYLTLTESSDGFVYLSLY